MSFNIPRAHDVPGSILAAQRLAARRAWLTAFYAATPQDDRVSRQVSRREDRLAAKHEAAAERRAALRTRRQRRSA